jgi:hypothetical protein
MESVNRGKPIVDTSNKEAYDGYIKYRTNIYVEHFDI